MTTAPTRPAPGRSLDWSTVLGTASVGLGVPPVAATRRVARAMGLEESAATRLTLTAVGARELGVASGLLTFPRRWMLWARVAGDAMDLAMLGRALVRRGRAAPARTVAATAAVAAVTAVDLWAAARGQRAESDVFSAASTTVARPVDEVYAFWRQLSNLPDFMVHLDSVEVSDARSSHWRVTAPFGRTVEWDAEIVEEDPGRFLAWRSAEGADVRNEGRVEFRPGPGGNGTVVRVTLRYRGIGVLARAAARYFGEEPRQHLDDDLRRFKQIMETGEVVRSDGALGGKHARREFPQRPAQPADPQELAEEETR